VVAHGGNPDIHRKTHGYHPALDRIGEITLTAFKNKRHKILVFAEVKTEIRNPDWFAVLSFRLLSEAGLKVSILQRKPKGDEWLPDATDNAVETVSRLFEPPPTGTCARENDS